MVAWKPSRNYMEVIDAAGRFLGNYSVGEKFNSVPASPPVVQHRGWLAPPVGGLNLNIDADVKQGLSYIGVGGVIRNHLGWLWVPLQREFMVLSLHI